MKKITLLFFMSLLSWCGYSQLALETFESNGTNLPAGWQRINVLGIAQQWNVVAHNPVTTPAYGGSGHVAFMQRENVVSGTTEDWLVTKQFNYLPNMQLRFQSRLTNLGDDGTTYGIKIHTGNTPLDTSSYTDLVPTMSELVLNPDPFQTDYLEKVFNLPVLPAGTQVYIAFVMYGDNGDRWLIDNVMAVQQCLDATNITVQSVGLNQAVINWGNPGNVNNWLIDIVPATSAPTTIGYAYAGLPPFTATVDSAGNPLQPNTDYKIYVRPNCGDGNLGNWSLPVNFSTVALGENCSAPINIATLPYSTTDNTSNYGDTVDGSPGSSGCTSTNGYLNGNDVFYTYTAPANGTISINVTGNGAYSGIFVYTSCANVGSACVGGATTGGTPAPLSIPNFTVTAGTTYYFVISTWATPQTTPYTLTIQQVNCLPPVGLPTTGQGLTSAQLSWTNPSGATSWQVVVQDPGDGIPPGAGLTVNTNSNYLATAEFDGTPLVGSTPYEYYVRADCGNGTFSAWAGPYAFNTTLCEAVNQCNYTFVMTDSWGDGWNGNTMTISQNGIAVATIGATFTGGLGPVSVTVPVCTGLPLTLFWNTGGGFPGEVGVSIVNNFGQTIYTKPAGTGGQGTQLYTTNVNCTTPPCLPPGGLNVSEISTTSVDIGWAGPPTGNWDYYVVPAGGPAPTSSTTGINTTSNPTTVNTGLVAATNYVFYVRVVCDGTTNSTWAGPFPFTTAVCPLEEQCVYKFILTDSWGDGWNGNTMNVIQNGVTVAVLGSNFTTGTGPITVNVAMCHDAPFQLFWNAGGAFANEVGVSIVNGTPFNQTLYSKPAGTGAQNTQLYSGTIDCINPACIEPTGLDAYDFTTDSAMLEWDGPATGSWQVYVVPAGDPAPADTTPGLPVTTNPVQVDLPTPGTNYEYYVRVMCDPTDGSDWAGPHEFNSMICEPEEQCNYIFEMTDSWGDGWNGNTMTIFQGGVPVATIGSTFTGGTGPIAVEVPLCPDVEFELFWNAGGGFANEVGITVYTPFEEDVYTKAPGTGAQNTLLYTGEADCTPPPCPKPQDLFTDALDLTSADLNWTEVGSATTWEVYVVPIGSPAPLPTDSGTSTTEMPYIATETVDGDELTSGTTYEWYVRAICGEEDGNSNWSGPIVFTTLIENDDCANAINVGTNPGLDCDIFGTGTLTGATGSTQAQSCVTWMDIEYDVWYSFEATATTHAVNINNQIGAFFQTVIYEGDDCGTLSQLACGDDSETVSGLTIGETYYVRVYTTFMDPTDVTSFEICINTPPPPIRVSQDEYTVEELVEDVLIGSECAQISNVQSGTGTSIGVNGIGYFNQNNSTFPMAEGIVLVSGDAMNAPGPNDFPAGWFNDFPGWAGDADLEEAVGLPADNSNDASWISFDFVTMTDELNFNFLFASEEYNAGFFECFYSDAFAFILTDLTTNVSTNLAVLPGTSIPIQVTNIHPDNPSCDAINESYFGQYNDGLFDPINFNGQTTIMTATSPVQINHAYNIKIVIANASDNSHNSAVFLEAGSFDFGQPNLGDPSLESELTAVCAGGSRLLDTDLDYPENFEFVWYQDDEVIVGADGPTYLVTEEGEYRVEATYLGASVECTSEASVVVEFFDPVEDLTNAPDLLAVCDPDGYATFDLTENTDVILEGVTGTYNVYYYLTEADAELGDHLASIANPEAFTNTIQFEQTIWVRIEFILASGEICSGVKSFDVRVEDNTPEFTITEDFSICEGTEGTITVTPTNYDGADATYVWTHDGDPFAGTGNTITVTEAGEYEVTVNTGCVATSTVVVITTPVPVADDPADVTICGSYVLPVLTTGNYFTGTGGTGTQLNAGETITSTQDVFVFAESGTTPNCTDENVFTVTIVPNPVVTTPGDVSACVSYTLPALATGNYFTGTGGTGTQLNEGELVTTSQTIYVYAESGTTPNCTAEESFDVTITDFVEADAPADVTACDSYVLPALSADNNYYTEANGAGTLLNAGDVITSTQEIHVYVATPTTPSCTDDNVFTVTIVPSPVAVTPGDQSACDSYVLPALAAGNYYTGTGGTGTMLNAGDTVTSTQTIFVLVETGTTPNCTGEASFTVTIIPSPVADAPVDVTSCDSYVLPALSPNNNYYTGANGTGTMLSAGETITGTQQIHVFATTGTTPNCTDDNVFTVTIVPSPVVTTPGNQTVCDSYVLPALTVGNYFTGTAGTGTQLNAGETVTTSQTIYVYAQSGTTPNCTDEDMFTVTIITSPVADAPGNVASCDSYVLPSLGVGNYYTGLGGTGTQLAAGSTVSTTQTLYVYAQTGTTPNCTDENSFTVTIIPTPTIAITEGCNEDNVYVLEAIFTDELYTPDNVTFAWTDASGNSLGTDSSIIINAGGTYYVTVTPYGDTDCPVPGQITVIDTTCDVQRGISPNNDGKNDGFNLTALDVRKLSIFNRYGAEVYSFKGAYTDQWEGQGKGGEDLPTGTYFYMIERANGESRTGWVYINREN